MRVGRKPLLLLIASILVLGAGCGPKPAPTPPATSPTVPEVPVIEGMGGGGFDEGAAYAAPAVTIDPAVGKDFDVKTITNLATMEQAYGFTFSAAERAALAEHKFLVKNVLDTNIRPTSGGDNVREFVQLYGQVAGPRNYLDRTQANAEFWSSDVFFDAYNNLFTELLKEMENKTFYPAMKSLSADLYQAASQKLAAASSEAEKAKWTKVRNYFAVPDALFSTAGQPLTEKDYYKDGAFLNPADVQSKHDAADSKIDTYGHAADFVRGLKLDADSERAVLADLQTVFKADDKGVPAIFEKEYQDYTELTKISFTVDFTQFTPRGTYASSSLRREYFRGMKWYIMLPFFLKSADLTTYAFAVSQLLAENPKALQDYDQLESAIGFMVGKSDDLMPAEYLQALAAAKGAADPAAVALDFLAKAHDPKIKDLAAFYPAVGVEQSDEVRLLTKGMRFFSGKFIIDSYWTGFLTQGDEAPRPGYSQKLPPMASALEVMTLLGSDYAKTQIPKLDFYGPNTSKAIDQALAELAADTAKLGDADWQSNLYNAWLWTIKSLFNWQAAHKTELPRFMQSLAWEAKTLQTAAAWWTQLRHATILYAKQSFAELGAGGPACDSREVPPPPKAYIEPQAEAYARLSYLAKRTDQGLKGQGYQLENLAPLENFIKLMDTVQAYVGKELANAELNEKVAKQVTPDSDQPSGLCTSNVIADGSDWETLRLGLLNDLKAALPVPTEGPVLEATNRRAAIVADVHTGGDSDHPTRILYEATGVPYVIFTAVSDANGPRLTVGFISSQHEFTKEYGGQRLTDQEWQKTFYAGSDPYDAFHYTEKKGWPTPNAWYEPLFNLK